MVRMARNIIGLGLVLALSIHGRPLRAEEPPLNWFISPIVGFSLFPSGEDIADSPVYGFGAGKRFAEHWRFEGSLGYLNSELRGRERSDLEIYQLAMSLLYDFTPSKRLVPYVQVGGGGYHADPEAFGAKSGVLLHVGAGLRYRLNPRLFLKGEVRHQTFFGMVDNGGKRKTTHNLTTLLGLDVTFPQRPVSVAAAAAAPSLRKEREAPAAKNLPVANAPLEQENPLPAVSTARLSDEELRRIDAAPVSETVEKSLSSMAKPDSFDAGGTFSPRFSRNTEKFLDWAPGDSQKIGDLVEAQPSGKFLLVADVDEGRLTFAQFKLLEKRMLRLRLVMIERFGLDSEAVEILSAGALPRRLQDLGRAAVIIRVRPMENGF